MPGETLEEQILAASTSPGLSDGDLRTGSRAATADFPAFLSNAAVCPITR